MLRWPSPDVLTPIAREHLDRFRSTSAVKELEEDRHRWEFAAWPWMQDEPVHFIVRNECLEERAYTFERGGLWSEVLTDVAYILAACCDAHDPRAEPDDADNRRFARRLRNALHPHHRVIDANQPGNEATSTSVSAGNRST